VTTRTLAKIAAALEVTVGSCLIFSPTLVAHLLLGASLSSGGIAVGRVGGFGLVSLGFACWPSKGIVTAQPTSALFTYNLLSSLYIGYLSVVGGFVGYLLWPASALHGLLALLLARPAYETVRQEWQGVHFPKITIQIVSEIVPSPNEKAKKNAERNSRERTAA
jgi:hypothetical protein